MKHITIVCHDAGGAEILSSWLRRAKCYAHVVVTGPAEKIFKSKCPQVQFSSLDDVLAKTSWLITGTSWQNKFELNAILKAKSLGIKTVTFLDHWVNYLERFKYKKKIILPDEIWVGDKDAENIAKKVFVKTPVILKSNPYFCDVIDKISNLNKKKINFKKIRILYVCEPTSVHASSKYGNARYWGYTEDDALRFFFENILKIFQSVDLITIRPHPSEREEKYYWVNDLTNLSIKFGGKKDLIEEIFESNVVVGCETTALVVGLMANKRVISSIPPTGHPCQLPHSGIENLPNLIGEKTS